MKYGNNTSRSECHSDLYNGTVGVAGVLLSSPTAGGSRTNLTEMARALEFSPRLVNESLHSLRENGLIEMKRGRIIIKNENSLRQVSALPRAGRSGCCHELMTE